MYFFLGDLDEKSILTLDGNSFKESTRRDKRPLQKQHLLDIYICYGLPLLVHTETIVFKGFREIVLNQKAFIS